MANNSLLYSKFIIFTKKHHEKKLVIFPFFGCGFDCGPAALFTTQTGILHSYLDQGPAVARERRYLSGVPFFL